jgi:rhodanese-related sulfurtransferase
MAAKVTAEQVRELVGGGGQLLEVLPHEEYEEQHLPGAISLPLKQLDADAVAVAGLSRDKAAIVYCWDSI